MQDRLGKWLLLFGMLGCAVAGQYYFARRPEFFWDAVILYGLSAILMLTLVRARAETANDGAVPIRRAGKEAWLRGALIAISLFLGVCAVLMLVRPLEQYWPVFLIWIAAIAICVLAYLPRPRLIKPGFFGAWMRVWWPELALVSFLILGAFVLRAWRIDTIPWTLSGDEGNFGRWAREVLDGRLVNMFSTGHLSMPSMYIFWQAAWLRLAGDNVVGLRLPWAVIGALSILGAYLLVRRLFGRGMALLVALLLAGYHYHLHYSRLGLNNIADPFFVVWSLYFFVVGSEGKRRWAWALSGVLAGLAFYFYTGGRQVPVILACVFVWAALSDREFLVKNRSGVPALVIGFLVAVGPMALYAAQHPDDFNARINQIGIVQSGWLAREADKLGQSQVQVMGDQFRRVLFAFNFYRDRTDFYRPAIPLMDFASSILFLLGLVLSVSRLIKRGPDPPSQLSDQLVQLPWRYAVFVIWFFVVIISGGMLTESAPSSQRIVSSAIPAVFFVAVALKVITQVVAELLELRAAGAQALAVILAVGLTVISLRYYFGPYQSSWAYGSFNGEVATRIGYYLRDLGPGQEEYFFGAPRMYADFGSTAFIAKDVPVIDVLEPLKAPPTITDSGLKPVFVFLPERLGELDLVKQAYPRGVEEQVYRIADRDAPNAQVPLLFVAYRAN
jgi:4-amino-4-deoxy-L-arabinose transferase-like glycosyltransferase